MSQAVHIFRTNHQPATRFIVDFGDDIHGKPLRKTFQFRRRQLCFTDCCRKKRQRGNCTIQVYYDGTYYWCRPGKGCK